MEPIEFIKSCFAIACVLIAFAIFIKVSFALVDWLVERIKEDTLKLRIKREPMDLTELRQQSLEEYNIWIFLQKEQRGKENDS